jgi:DNA-binding CsgD family transcriptional regulator
MEQIERSIERVCAAGLDSASLRREIIARVLPVLGFDAYAFSTCDPETGLLAHTIADGIPGDLGKQFAEDFYAEECALISLHMGARNWPVFSMVEMSPRARDATRNAGLRSQLHVSLATNNRVRGLWCLMWAEQTPAAESRARALLQRVAPHVAYGLRAASLVDDGLAATEADVTAPGILVLNAAGHPTLRTPIAVRCLADIADSGVGADGDVPLSVLGLAAHVRNRAGRPAGAFVRVRGASGRWYLLRGSLTEPDATGESSVVIVVRPALRHETAAMLERLHSLSEREREVVVAAARGDSTKRIAAQLCVSPHTVEEHMERACRKIGVRGRKALVAKIFVDGPVAHLNGLTISDVPGQHAESVKPCLRGLFDTSDVLPHCDAVLGEKLHDRADILSSPRLEKHHDLDIPH